MRSISYKKKNIIDLPKTDTLRPRMKIPVHKDIGSNYIVKLKNATPLEIYDYMLRVQEKYIKIVTATILRYELGEITKDEMKNLYERIHDSLDTFLLEQGDILIESGEKDEDLDAEIINNNTKLDNMMKFIK